MKLENRILTELPMKYGVGANKDKLAIDWKGTVGMELELLYEGEIYKVKVIKYEKTRLWVDYNGYVKDGGIDYRNFNNCKFGGILKLKTKEFKYEIGQILKDENRDMIITDKKYKFNDRGYQRFNEKWYKYTCNTCGWTEGWMEENNLNAGNGCSCCRGFVSVLGINTIWNTDRWMCDLGVSEEDAKKYTSQSNKKIEVVCPNCGNKKEMTVCNIYTYKSIGCVCGDGKSYISKYIHNLLNQLNIKYDTEVKYEWNKYINPITNKKSQASMDFIIYINNIEIPLETDGEFHRKDNIMSGQTKEHSEYIDKKKDENCLKYLGEETIRISNEGDIKNNILSSKLNEILDLTNINWFKCEEFALSNLVKEVCDYWNNKQEWETIADVGLAFKISRDVVSKYVKKGAKLNWCSYNPRAEYLKGVRKKGKCSKSIKIFKNGKLLGIYPSMIDLSNRSIEDFGIFLNSKSISLVCRGKQKEYRGYTFNYTN